MVERVRLTVYATLDVTESNWERIRQLAYGASDKRPMPSTINEAKVLAVNLDLTDVVRLSKTKLTTYEMAREVDDLGFTLTDAEMRVIVSTYRMDGMWSHVSARSVGLSFADCYRLVLLGYLEEGQTNTGRVYRLTDAGRLFAEHIISMLKREAAEARAELRAFAARPAIDRLEEAHQKDMGDSSQDGEDAG